MLDLSRNILDDESFSQNPLSVSNTALAASFKITHKWHIFIPLFIYLYKKWKSKVKPVKGGGYSDLNLLLLYWGLCPSE